MGTQPAQIERRGLHQTAGRRAPTRQAAKGRTRGGNGQGCGRGAESAPSAAFDVGGVVEEALDLTRNALPRSVLLHCMAATPLLILGDAAHLHDAVIKLCSNAIRAMQAGGLLKVTVEPRDVAAPRRLSHGVLQPGRYAVLAVEDEGCGMDEAGLQRVFDPLLPAAAKCSEPGLGLASVWMAIARLGGAIDAQSEPTRGTRFSVYLPLCSTGQAFHGTDV